MSNEIDRISRLRMGTDGPGIRTLILFHGCPLKCKYCWNKECNNDKALRSEYPIDELIHTVEIDSIYFKMTGGGVTFGGGEPLTASAYISDFCVAADQDWNYVIETSLFVPWENIERLIPYIDLWIVDIKSIDNEIYEEYTGQNNEIVLDNLRRLSEIAGPDRIRIRVPIIPGYNSGKMVYDQLAVNEDISECAENIEIFEYQLC